jgi:hypothetical protein
MLDAFIIEKIRRDRERAGQDRRLQIEKNPPPRNDAWGDRGSDPREDEPPQRGVVVIDFTV